MQNPPGNSASGTARKGRFTPEWIQQLKQSVSLIDIASENIELRKSGARFMGRCPFHGDRSPSFSVNKDFYYCFGCKENGDVISFVTKLHGLNFEEACEDLAEKVKLAIPEGNLSSAEEKEMYLRRVRSQKAARLNHFASLQYYHQNLLKGNLSPLFQEARDYLKKRGITAKTIENFQIGVASSQYEGLTNFLTQGKAPLDIAREYGLIRASQKQAGDYDVFRDRLLFPLIDVRGRVCGFGGRILPSMDDKKQPKYYNSPESELFQKSKFLYALYQAKRAIREEETVIVVEGYFDAVSMHQAGIENVVATCGTSLTEDHLRTLSRLAKKIIVFFDQDQAGISATVKAMELGLKNGLLLHGIQFESKLDPDEFLLENPAENLPKLKQWITQSHPLLDHRIQDELQKSEGSAEARTDAIKMITHWLEVYADPVGKSVRVDQLIQKWKVPAAALGNLARSSMPVRPSAPQQNRPGPPPGYPQNSYPQNQGPNQNRGASPQRRRPISLFDRQLLQFLVKFNEYGGFFLEAKKDLPEKDSLSVFFDDTELQNWVQAMSEDPAGFTRLKLAPETVVQAAITQELRSVIMEGLLQEKVPGEEAQLKGLLKKGIHKSWARFSQRLKAQMADADARQDMEKFKELSEQFLDLQRKLKEFEDSYVSGKSNDSSDE